MSLAEYQLIGWREMAASDLQGGTVQIGNGSAGYPATVGVFDEENPLMAGGPSPRLLGTVEIELTSVGANYAWRKGQAITVQPNLGAVRNCKLDSWKQAGALWQLTLHDLNQGA